MSTSLVFASHPDDETVGCGGSLLREIAGGTQVHWAIVSQITTDLGFSAARVASRQREIEAVAQGFGFAGVHQAAFPAARIDTVAMADRVAWMAALMRSIDPDTLYLPYPGDVHNDHAAVFHAAMSCTKSFRYPGLRRVYCYETPSETEFAIDPLAPPFKPNRFVDISAFIDQKIDLMRLYEGEMGDWPFPRSEQAIRALAAHRGVVAGCDAAESFMVLREIER